MALATVVAGCGGDDDTDNTAGATTTPEPKVVASSLTKEEFTEKANAICNRSKKRGLKALGVYTEQHEGSRNQLELIAEAVQVALLPEIQSQIEEIRALGAPRGDEERVEDFLAALQDGVDTAGEAPDPSDALFAESFRRSAELGHRYGIDACAYG